MNMNPSGLSSSERTFENAAIAALALEGMPSKPSVSVSIDVGIDDEVRAFRGQISSWAATYAQRDRSTKSLDAATSLRGWSRGYFGVTNP
jgi:hypothetical protein